jgi:hypothetical protein
MVRCRAVWPDARSDRARHARRPRRGRPGPLGAVCHPGSVVRRHRRNLVDHGSSRRAAHAVSRPFHPQSRRLPEPERLRRRLDSPLLHTADHCPRRANVCFQVQSGRFFLQPNMSANDPKQTFPLHRVMVAPSALLSDPVDPTWSLLCNADASPPRSIILSEGYRNPPEWQSRQDCLKK